MEPSPANSHAITALEEPAPEVAEALYASQSGEEDVSWADLAPEDRDGFVDIARTAIALHMGWLERHGFKILPPGAVLRPKSDREAEMMAEAVRLYRAAKSRKGGLLMGDRKLILPKGVH